MQLSNQELKHISGGAISGALINSLVRGINAILEVSRSLGSALRRVIDKTICTI